VVEVLARPDDYKELRIRARQTILDRYALQKLLPIHIGLLRRLAARQ